MTTKDADYEFHIDAFTPDTIPMARLAEYMADIATLCGNKKSIHFAYLKAGSTKIAFRAEREAIPKVNERLRAIGKGEAPPDALKAVKQLNKKLASDNATGSLTYSPVTQNPTAKIIQFPGKNIPKLLDYGKIEQQGSIEGFLIRLGGKDETIPVWLKEGEQIHTGIFVVGQEKVRELKKYLCEPFPIRVHGLGKWYRDDDGIWVMDGFRIDSVEPLDDSPLDDVVNKLQNTEGAGWKAIDDPIKELQKLRNDPDNKVH